MIGTGRLLTTSVHDKHRVVCTYLVSSCRSWRERRAGCFRGRFDDGARACGRGRATSRSALLLLLLILFFLAGPDCFEASLYVIHNTPDGDLAGWVCVGGDALLNHVEEVVASCGVSGVVRSFGGRL